MKRIWCYAVLILLIAGNTSQITPMAIAQLEDWSDDIRLTFNDAKSIAPAIAVEGNNVHVVYGDNESGGWNDLFLWYIKSVDDGNTWSSPVCLEDSPPTRIGSPKIAVNGNNIHVIWPEVHDRRIHYIRSTDNGNNWSSEIVLTPIISKYITLNWDIGVYENNLHVIYVDSNHKLSYIQSTDNGITWSSPKILIPSKSMALESALAVNGSNVHIVWEDMERAGQSDTDIFYIKSENNGVTWGKDINITCTPINSNYMVDIAVDKDYICVVYGHQEASARQVYLSYSEDNGNNWVRNIKLSNSTGYITYPNIAVEGERIFVVWTDPRYHHGHQVYFKRSLDRGKSWSNDTRLVYGSPYSTLPDIAVYENTAHVVWTDHRDENAEIYYKRYLIPVPPMMATIDIDPDTLNLKSKGKWITAYIELEEGYDVNDINISTILLEDTIPSENHPTEIGDYDNDGVPDLLVKFDRSNVEDILTTGDSITLTIKGNFMDSGPFEGSDPIRVILPP